MSAAARGAAGARYLRDQRNRRQREAETTKQATEYLSRFVRDPQRARELAAEAAALRKGKR